MGGSAGRMAALVWMLGWSAAVAAAEIPQPEWGKVSAEAGGLGIYRLQVKEWPVDGRLPLPPLPGTILSCRQATADAVASLDVLTGGETAWVVGPPVGERTCCTTLFLHTAEKSQTFPDGRIALLAADAVPAVGKPVGAGPLELRWTFDFTRWGMYAVRVTGTTAAENGTELAVEVGGAKVSGTLQPTGRADRTTSRLLGTLYLPKGGKQPLVVRSPEGAGLRLTAVTLEPACEGTPPVQAADGSVLLHGRDAWVRGTNLRYEPAPQKQTLGYWTRATDAALWRFTLDRPGEFDVEVLQGCGTGQGGSEVAIDVNGTRLRFTVEDTGHFQNFKPRVVGRVRLPATGEFELSVAPLAVKKSAALDLRQIRLIPATK